MKNIATYFRNGMVLLAGLGVGLTAAAQMVVVNVNINQPAALVANAGSPNGIQLCEGDTVTLGGTPAASGGTAPFFYLWSPSTTMSGATLANPQQDDAADKPPRRARWRIASARRKQPTTRRRPSREILIAPSQNGPRRRKFSADFRKNKSANFCVEIGPPASLT